MKIKKATKNDAQEIVELVNSAYRGESSKIGWTTEADLLGGQRTDKKAIEEIILSENNFILIGTNESGEITVCANLEKVNKNICYFGLFAVSPKLQGSGIGKIFLHEAESFVKKELNCKIMEMTVITLRKELIEFYERRGYKFTGEFRDFPYNDERFGIPKRDDIKLGVWQKEL